MLHKECFLNKNYQPFGYFTETYSLFVVQESVSFNVLQQVFFVKPMFSNWPNKKQRQELTDIFDALLCDVDVLGPVLLPPSLVVSHLFHDFQVALLLFCCFQLGLGLSYASTAFINREKQLSHKTLYTTPPLTNPITSFTLNTRYVYLIK